jgi:hypothetical protein
MGIIRNRLTRRFPTFGLLSDLALVGAAASRLFQRQSGTGPTAKASTTELALAGGAAFRLLRRFRRRRKAQKAARAATSIG